MLIVEKNDNVNVLRQDSRLSKSFFMRIKGSTQEKNDNNNQC